MSRTVYPVEGRFLQDRPHIEHDCDDPFCVESGAFTTKRPRAAIEEAAEPVPAKSESEE